MPPETLTASEQLAMFASKGITAQEMVALLGSHTVSHSWVGLCLAKGSSSCVFECPALRACCRCAHSDANPSMPSQRLCGDSQQATDANPSN